VKRTFILATSAIMALSGCSDQAGDGGAKKNKAVACEPDTSPLTVKAANTDFDTDCLAAKSDAAFTIKFVNEEDLDHNISILKSKGGEKLFTGQNIKKGEVTYDVPALQAGKHYFQCDTHPDVMNGVFVVGG